MQMPKPQSQIQPLILIPTRSVALRWIELYQQDHKERTFGALKWIMYLSYRYSGSFSLHQTVLW